MISKISQKAFEIYCRIVLNTYIRVKAKGKENLPNQQCLIVSNHSSHLDYLILALFCGKGYKNVSVVAAQDYWFENKARDWFTKLFLNAIPIHRKKLYQPNMMKEVIDNCKEKLTHKNSLIVFPEGKRSIDGQIQPFKQGAAIIAQELGFTVIPAYIHGSYEAWPKGQILMAPRNIEVYFGKPISIKKESKKDTKDFTKIIENQVMALKKTHEQNSILYNTTTQLK